MLKWTSIAIIFIVVVFFLAILLGQAHESAWLNQLKQSINSGVTRPVVKQVDFSTLTDLPIPVARYFRQVLTDGQPMINRASLEQTGILRSDAMSERWSRFKAHQIIMPAASGFIWDARIDMPFGSYVRVVDSYSAGAGSARVSLMSAFAVASETDSSELNSGSLLRYLAEGVWCPTVLLPQSGVTWTAIDDHSALATLSNQGIRVSLEFRFNETGYIVGIYSPGRYASSDGGYILRPWEGHFSDYQQRAGMRVPLYGEVGWYIDGALQLVWKGNIIDIQYEFD